MVLKQIISLGKASPRRSPRQRRVKRTAGSGEE